MRRILLTLALSCIVATASYAADSADAIGVPSGQTGGRSDIPILTSFAVGGPNMTDVFCTGLGWHAGLFWVCGSDFDGNGSNGSGDNGVYFYDETGLYLGGIPQPTLDTWGWRDSGYDGTHMMFGASSPHTGQIFWVDANSLVVEYTVSGCPHAQCRALAIDMSAGGMVQYKAGDFSNPIYTMLWTVGPGAAMQITSWTAPGAAYGLAYDPGNGGIWVTSADYSGELYFIDATTGTLLNTYNILPEIEIFGGAAMASTSYGCDLWVMCQCSPNDAVFGLDTGGNNPFACGATAVEPATWGAVKARYND